MQLGRQVLDQQLVDRNDVNMGKVDGLVLELREGGPPRVAAILTGGHLLARRLHPRLETWAKRLMQSWGPDQVEPLRIPWEKVAAADGMPWEHWVRDHILCHIPGA
jgi:hypothetical protein